jgi:hypothetical protein
VSENVVSKAMTRGCTLRIFNKAPAKDFRMPTMPPNACKEASSTARMIDSGVRGGWGLMRKRKS